MRTLNPRFALRPDFADLSAAEQTHILFNQLSVANRAAQVAAYILREALDQPDIARQVAQAQGLLEGANYELHRRKQQREPA